MNKVLVVGSGGREHAIGWKLKQSPKVGELFFAPGNGGTSLIGTNIDFKVTDNQRIVNWSKENKIDLVVVASDEPLANGLVDDLIGIGIKAFGSTKKAAEIEWSKAYAKDLMRKAKIPTAKFETFNDFEKAKKYLEKQPLPIVIKASGLALGKGVMIAESLEFGVESLKKIMVEKIFGESGSKVIIEEFIQGSEVSFHLFSDGKTYSLFPISQDHKPIFDQDKGPNTGGMGTIAPVPWVTSKLVDEVKQKIVEPILKALKDDGREYKGVLYPGLMITKDGPKVLEFNARFGDPETQSYMRILETDLFEVLIACIEGTLDKLDIKWGKKSACCIVIASKSYPESSEKGIEIKGLDSLIKSENDGNDGVVVFHAGTKRESGQFYTNGGRVLGVSAIGDNLKEALDKAYAQIGSGKIYFEGMQYRKDIGKKSLDFSG